jgi:hypothetical protein
MVIDELPMTLSSRPVRPFQWVRRGAVALISLLLAGGLMIARNNANEVAEKDAATTRIIEEKDRQIRSITAEKELLVRSANADKYIAIQEVGDQKAENGLYYNTDTIGFSELKNELPWLDGLRRTVAFVRFGGGFGSAVLLDKAGTISLCAHELPHGSHEKIRLFFNRKANGQTIEVKPYNFRYDKKHDLMFATIAPALIKKYGLEPIRWGRMGYDHVDDQAGQEVISVGWPMPSFRLHATRGVITGISLTDLYHNPSGGISVLNCKVISSGVSFAGMSGGGVFRDRKFVGIINASSAPGAAASTDFTPVDLIRETYIGLYPRQARDAGMRKIDNPDTPAECRFNSAEFLSREDVDG